MTPLREKRVDVVSKKEVHFLLTEMPHTSLEIEKVTELNLEGIAPKSLAITQDAVSWRICVPISNISVRMMWRLWTPSYSGGHATHYRRFTSSEIATNTAVLRQQPPIGLLKPLRVHQASYLLELRRRTSPLKIWLLKYGFHVSLQRLANCPPDAPDSQP